MLGFGLLVVGITASGFRINLLGSRNATLGLRIRLLGWSIRDLEME